MKDMTKEIIYIIYNIYNIYIYIHIYTYIYIYIHIYPLKKNTAQRIHILKIFSIEKVVSL